MLPLPLINVYEEEYKRFGMNTVTSIMVLENLLDQVFFFNYNDDLLIAVTKEQSLIINDFYHSLQWQMVKFKN